MTPDPDRQAAILNSILEKLNSWEKQREVGFNEVSKLVFYAQSTGTVISGRF